MANGIAESKLDPEARAMDSNGRYSNGLWQFNEASYPNSASLVTGNCGQDIRQQVAFLKTVVSGQALAGSTGAQVASNFAANFERCKGCQSGGSQNAARTANAATVAGWITSGRWPTATAGITGSGGGTGSTPGGDPGATLTGNTTRCLVGGGSVIPCLLDASQARALIGGACLLAGGLIMAVGLALVAVNGLSKAGVSPAALTPAGAVLSGLNKATPKGAPKAKTSPSVPSGPSEAEVNARTEMNG
jgi:hypothetical protein